MNSNNFKSIKQTFGDTLCQLAKSNKNIYVVSMDLKSSVALAKFAAKFPTRFIECGVAENNAAGVAAGLSKSGKTVFLVTYACFSPAINWATIKQSICYSHNKVIIVGSHGGLLTGELGATHQMLEDVSLMRAMPSIEVFAPIDANECKKIIETAVRSPRSSYIRLVRPTSPVVYPSHLPFSIGKSHILQHGKDLTILGYGPILANFFNTWKGLDLSTPSLELINCSSIKPIDELTIKKSIAKTNRCLVIEDHQKNGGLGEAVASLILKSRILCKFEHLGIEDRFGQSAHDSWELYDHYGLGLKDIQSAIEKLMK